MSTARPSLGNSLLLRLPLAAATLVVLTALLMAAGLGLLTQRYLIEDVDSGAFQAMSSWTKSLPTLIQQDNVWAVYEALTSVTGADAEQHRNQALAVVLGPGGRVFASSDPRAFPTARAPDWSPLWSPGTLRLSPPEQATRRGRSGLSPPIQSGHWRIYIGALRGGSGPGVGTLVYAVSDTLYRSRLLSMLWWIAGITALAVAVFVPVIWGLSRRMLHPLGQLRRSMTQDGEQAQRVGAALARRPDEVGALAGAFVRLLEQVDQARQAEKLAAVGSLAAATAHEINNPLGGMINAVRTAERFGTYDGTTRQTLELLDRGLEQLRTIAQALLAQTRPAERDLARQDFHDLVELIGPCQHERGIELQTGFDIPARIPVAAGPVRQATLNILLNACHAALPGSVLGFRAEGSSAGLLRIAVRNQGPAPPAAMLSSLAPSSMPMASGVGLWESRRLLSDIGGSLTLSHEAGWTTALIEIPLRA
nr:HAMP domain-containing sensor histidine kinase [Thiomonas sp.]